MIKAVAIVLMLAALGSSISEFSLSPKESFTLHFDSDYVFTLTECGNSCISLRISQMNEGKTTWTGQIFDLQEGKSYPFQMEFDDVSFESVYVVSVESVTTLRVSYREVVPLLSGERVVKVTSEKESTEPISLFVVGELGVVVFLVFFVAHRVLRKRSGLQRNLPRSAVGFHDSLQQGIPRSDGEDPDLELLREVTGWEDDAEIMNRREGVRWDEDNENAETADLHRTGQKKFTQDSSIVGRRGVSRLKEDDSELRSHYTISKRDEDNPDLELVQHLREMERLKEKEMQHRMRRLEEEEKNLGLDWI